MAKTPYLRDKDEEIVNALLHAVGFGLSLAGTASLAYSCIDKSMLHWVAAMSFMLTLNFTYAMSAVYHGTLEPGKKRRRRMRLSHPKASFKIQISSKLQNRMTMMKMTSVPKSEVMSRVRRCRDLMNNIQRQRDDQLLPITNVSTVSRWYNIMIQILV